jgi:signal transduction histidine kinase
VTVDGRVVGRVVISGARGGLLTSEDSRLQDSLNRLHLAAGAAAIAAALLVAFLLAQALSRPLRRIRVAAERVEAGDLAARVELGGDPEMRSVGRALNRLAETLEHEEEIRRASVADLAHELRTPVNGLLSRIEAAQDAVLEGPDNLEAMHAETLRLTHLLDDIARLADAERPGLLLRKQPLDLAGVARVAAESFAPRFAERKIGFRAQLESVFVLGDGDRLGQIAANLLSNALRYTEPGGEVRLTVQREADDAVLEVADTGIGIASEDLRYIFTRFWRGDRSRSRATGGAGIGLAIVRELVRAHDARIDVESTPGRGSCFRVKLRAVALERATSPEPQPAEAPAMSAPAGRSRVG